MEPNLWVQIVNYHFVTTYFLDTMGKLINIIFVLCFYSENYAISPRYMRSVCENKRHFSLLRWKIARCEIYCG